MKRLPPRVCARCVLPETFPGIRFDDEGTCNHCKTFGDGGSRGIDHKTRYERKFTDLLAAIRNVAPRGNGSYEALLAFSGGKDSSYTLKVLKERYQLRILAATFNHGFVSPQALRNVKSVTEALNVDHWMIAPGAVSLRRAFARSIDSHRFSTADLMRASSVCNTCMYLVKSLLVRTAIEMRIPLIAYGWSPGQAPLQASVMKLNPPMVREMQDVIANNLAENMGEAVRSFVLQERHFQALDSALKSYDNRFLYNIHPLAFLHYDEREILSEIEALGWMPPSDTDSNSTNCLLNGLANQVHVERYGYHPYSFEIAKLVREGHMTRKAGLAKLSAPPDDKVIREVRCRLGIE